MRAEVFRNPFRKPESEWRVAVHRGDIPNRHLPIKDREEGPTESTWPTHAAALAFALDMVGLTVPPEHRETP